MKINISYNAMKKKCFLAYISFWAYFCVYTLLHMDIYIYTV